MRNYGENTKDKYLGLKRLLALLASVGLWAVSIYFSYSGFKFDSTEILWFGIVLALVVMLIGTPADFGLKYEDVFFAAADGTRLHGWWVPKRWGPGTFVVPRQRRHISHRLENIKLLHDLVGVQIFILTTGNTANPRAASAGKGPVRTRPRPTATWPTPGRFRPGTSFSSAAPSCKCFGRGPGAHGGLPGPDHRKRLHQLLGNGQNAGPSLFHWRPEDTLRQPGEDRQSQGADGPHYSR